MKSILLIAALFLANLSLAQTNVNGNQSGNWDLASSPYLVTNHITVPSGQTLSIEAGVEVRFQGYYKFNVLGNLQAIGTAENTILFTAENQSAGWGGIRVDSSDLITLTHCRIEHGFSSGEYPDIHGGALALLSSDAVVENCTFADNATDTNGMGGAVYAINASQNTKFINNIFIRNNAYGEGGAIKFSGGNDVQLIHNEFYQNYCSYGGGAISFYSTYNAIIESNIFADNYTNFSDGGAIQTLGFNTRLLFSNNTLTNNQASTGDGGAISLNYAEAFFVNTIIYQNNGAYSDDLYVGIGSSAEVYYSNMPLPADATGHHNINANPQFQNAANYDFSLSETSQCIDSGIAYFEAGGMPLVDMSSGEYQGTSPDIGAIETQPPALIFMNGFE
jgi:hypothetical protein